MAKLTINPADVIDYKTPLYKEDREAKKVYRLLPETTADQVQYAGGQNGEAVKAALESGITAAQSAADAAQATANSASASAAQAGQTANSALSTANTAKSTADGVKAQVDNATAGLAATKAIADNALAAAVVMQGATDDTDGAQGLVPKPVAGNQNKYLRGDGTWQTPPDTDTTYNVATQSTNGLMSASDKTLFDEAEEAGQIGDPIYLGQVDANTVTETGHYIVDTNYEGLYANNWPITSFGIPRTNVFVNYQKAAGIIFQRVQNPWHSATRKGTINSDNSIIWDRWIFSYIITNVQSFSIYISKNGSDTNTGISPDYPVFTINRAIEIANAVNSSSFDFYIRFLFGAGNWGDITIRNLPYFFEIASYDGVVHTEYSEDLPYFNYINCISCSFTIASIVASSIYVANNSLCVILGYYKSIGQLTIYRNSICVFQNINSATNVWEIKNAPNNGALPVINLNENARIYTWALHIKLSQNITGDFLYTNNSSALLAQTTVFDETSYSIQGNKLRAIGDSFITTYELQGIYAWFDRVPGTGIVNMDNGTSMNGLPVKAVNQDNAIVPYKLSITSLSCKMGTYPTSGFTIGSMLNWTDNSNNLLHRAEFIIFPNLVDYHWRFWVNASQYFSIGVNYKWGTLDGVVFYFPTPPDSSNTNHGATTAWVNSKLGSGTALTALAALDETSEDYVETLEIKKQKAIAQINAEAQQAIYGGFPYEINGDEYFIDYSLFDQQNLASRAIIAEQNPNKIMSLPCRNEEGNKVWLDVSTDTVLAVHKYGLLSHTDAILKAADEKKSQIMAAETEAQIQAIILE